MSRFEDALFAWFLGAVELLTVLQIYTCCVSERVESVSDVVCAFLIVVHFVGFLFFMILAVLLGSEREKR